MRAFSGGKKSIATVLLFVVFATALQLGFINCSKFSALDAISSSSSLGMAPPVTPPNGGSLKPTLRYIGRFDTSDPSGPRFAWSGSAIEAGFTGTSVTMKLKSPSEVYFTVVIDGGTPTIVRVDGASQSYALATGLANGTHVVRVTRNNETFPGVSQFLGFDFGPGGAPAEIVRLPRYRMEVIGDSISCGYGDTGVGPTCSFTPATENNYLAYGSVAARLLDADVTTVAVSGRGVYHSYNGVPNDPSDPTMDSFYQYTIPSTASSPSGTVLYDFAQQPAMDFIVINLGTNDLSTNPPDAATLAVAYKKLVTVVRSKNPNAQLFFVAGTMVSGASLTTWKSALQIVVDEMSRAGDTKVHLVEFPAQDGSLGYGCDYHPSSAQQNLMGRLLAQSIKTDLGL